MKKRLILRQTDTNLHTHTHTHTHTHIYNGKVRVESFNGIDQKYTVETKRDPKVLRLTVEWFILRWIKYLPNWPTIIYIRMGESKRAKNKTRLANCDKR